MSKFKSNLVENILRIAVAGEFLGHGIFALQAKEAWFRYFEPFGITDPSLITTLLMAIGLMDVILAILVLVRPMKPLVLWMAFWGLWTALIRWPFGGDPIWDFIERFANFGAPLALYYLMWPSKKHN